MKYLSFVAMMLFVSPAAAQELPRSIDVTWDWQSIGGYKYTCTYNYLLRFSGGKVYASLKNFKCPNQDIDQNASQGAVYTLGKSTRLKQTCKQTGRTTRCSDGQQWNNDTGSDWVSVDNVSLKASYRRGMLNLSYDSKGKYSYSDGGKSYSGNTSSKFQLALKVDGPTCEVIKAKQSYQSGFGFRFQRHKSCTVRY